MLCPHIIDYQVGNIKHDHIYIRVRMPSPDLRTILVPQVERYRLSLHGTTGLSDKWIDGYFLCLFSKLRIPVENVFAANEKELDI